MVAPMPIQSEIPSQNENQRMDTVSFPFYDLFQPLKCVFWRLRTEVVKNLGSKKPIENFLFIGRIGKTTET
ncbi:hypothetical protein CH367_14505 [Leptospira barantonii]|uniref:Uncharacterized protein n=1 Tax=Leptospira barantonii TaxID=2023184 RepID=A0ABX4NNW1_9LEPT|nr:hypothetical protein CH367_14505 [Leptospira barantonii]